MELEEATVKLDLPTDIRPRLPEPPPVRLVTVEDAHVVAGAGIERELDQFYVGLLRFERELDGEFPIYRSENFRLIFDVLEPPIQREGMRALGIEVPSLAEVEQRLIDAEIEYTRQRGLTPGQGHLVLVDPGGNWLEISEHREIG
jgi:hypothetical protein